MRGIALADAGAVLNRSGGPKPTAQTGAEPQGVRTMNKRLPADPEGMNDDRAAVAYSALEAFQCLTGIDPKDDTAVSDLLCDLMHWCDRNSDEGFDVALTRARAHYAEETYVEENSI